MSLLDFVKNKLIVWLTKGSNPPDYPLCDFVRLQGEIKPCDVLLMESSSRVSEIIRLVTQSAWSHAAIYIGCVKELKDPVLKDKVLSFYDGPHDEKLLIESILGQGTIITPLSAYAKSHIRICRPSGISKEDSNTVIAFAIRRLGRQYALRHILDLARLLFPWHFLPRRWRSTIFEKSITPQTKEICSSMLAEAFSSVRFPILPYVISSEKKGLVLYPRNPKLYTPSDFDYSPYFEIIKYPVFEISGAPAYKNLPWQDKIISSDEELNFDSNRDSED